MVKEFKEGDKSQALCEKCGKMSTTFKKRSVPVNDSDIIVNDLLVGVCDGCNYIVSVPQQSVAQIKAAFEE